MQHSVYVFRSGALFRRGDTLYFEGEQGGRYLPVESIRDIYAFGEIDLNKRVLEFLCEKEIVIHFFNHYGYYVGSYYPREHYNSGHVILRQAAAYLDLNARLRLAKGFVSGAIANIVRVLRYYDNRQKNVAPALRLVEEQAAVIEAVPDVEHLMAVEGHARDAYYQAWDAILEDDDFRLRRARVVLHRIG